MMTLDVDSVRAFLMIADLQSFTQAATALGSTQGALSVKLRRLEDRLDVKLIERTPRKVRLSARGQSLLGAAREFVASHDQAVARLSDSPRRFALGIAAHVAGPEVPILLARLHAYDPLLSIEVQIDASPHLLDTFDRGVLDAAIVRRDDDRRDGETLAWERVGWYAARGFKHRAGEALRLASLSRTCGVRDLATRALDNAGLKWTDVFVGGGSSAVLAAVSAGLAIAQLSDRLAPPGTIDVGDQFGLPTLPPAEIVLHSSLSDKQSREALRTIAAAFREHRTTCG